MNKLASQKNCTIIGPATVGGLKPGCFKIGNTGGMLDNILMSKLYRAGSVAYVSKSGGMSTSYREIQMESTRVLRSVVTVIQRPHSLTIYSGSFSNIFKSLGIFCKDFKA